jgi:hypothetical protein
MCGGRWTGRVPIENVSRERPNADSVTVIAGLSQNSIIF